MDKDRQISVPAWVLAIAYAEHRATCSYCGCDRPDLCRVKTYRDQLLRGLATANARLDDEEPNLQGFLARAAADNQAALSRLHD